MPLSSAWHVFVSTTKHSNVTLDKTPHTPQHHTRPTPTARHRVRLLRAHDRAAPRGARRRRPRARVAVRRHLQGRVRRLVLRRLRGVQGREGDGRGEELPDAPAAVPAPRGGELLLRALQVPGAPRRLDRRHRLCAAGEPPQRGAYARRAVLRCAVCVGAFCGAACVVAGRQDKDHPPAPCPSAAVKTNTNPPNNNQTPRQQQPN